MPTIANSWELLLSAARDCEDVIGVLALSRFASGEQPFAELVQLEGVRRATDLVPVGSVAMCNSRRGSQQVLASGEGWTISATRFASGWASVQVIATDEDLLAKRVADVQAAAPAQPERESVPVEFWFKSGGEADERTRRIDAPAWSDVRRNYPETTAGALARLVALEPDGAVGRLLVWHGPPGTGKTSATRALLRAWLGWCSALVVTDPDQLFRDPGYLVQLLLDGDGDRWRLVVIEDADELLGPDARERSGSVLARLLNASDGLIGQGLNVLILLTTNQPRIAIDPAILRPGRCLAEVPFARFSPDEAAAWLGEGGKRPSRDVSLAELYRLRAGESLADGGPPPGQYL